MFNMRKTENNQKNLQLHPELKPVKDLKQTPSASDGAVVDLTQTSQQEAAGKRLLLYILLPSCGFCLQTAHTSAGRCKMSNSNKEKAKTLAANAARSVKIGPWL